MDIVTILEFLTCCLTGVGWQGKICLMNTWDSNMKLALVIILVSIYTILCFQSTLQWLIG